ncbi:MAG: hypothetical protein ABSA92_07700 [Candidatus Bathyarchaeia archaeon]|jgi:hypothetical protein
MSFTDHTLKAVGFSTDEAKEFLGGIEDAAGSQIKAEPKREPDTVMKYGMQRSERRRSRVKGLLLIVWGYAVAVWLYVIAMQLVFPAARNHKPRNSRPGACKAIGIHAHHRSILIPHDWASDPTYANLGS